MPLLDVSAFASGAESAVIKRPDSELERRRATALSHAARCFFKPRCSLPVRGTKVVVPDQHQLLPLDSFLTPWMAPLLKDAQGVPQHFSDTVIVADEGGMGKTYSSVIVALHYLNNYGGAVIVLCPPLQTNQWFDAFRGCGVERRRRSASCLSNGDFGDGVTIISKHSLMRHPLSGPARSILGERVQLCILDEGHEGMIASSASNYSAPLSDSIRDVLLHCQRRLVATATPIRKEWTELVALMTAVSDDDDDVGRLTSFLSSVNGPLWVRRLRDEWLPALDRLHRGTLSTQDVQLICDSLGEMVPFLSQSEVARLNQSLPGFLPAVSQSHPKARARLARDLHPFGKYMSISLRDDIGEWRVHLHYRSRRTRVVPIADWTELTDCIRAVAHYQDDNWSVRILRSCPINALDFDRYTTFNPAVSADKAAADLLVKASEADPRLAILEEVCETARSNHLPGKRAGVVVFCRWLGTVAFLEKWAKRKGLDVYTLSGLKDPNSLPSSKMWEERLRQKRKLDRAKESSLDDSKTTLLICGEGGTVGLDMDWATQAVHWDIGYGTVENIAQKTWRLDRRWNGAADIDQDFYVTFLVFEQDLSRTGGANDTYCENRILLGDRRYHGSGPSPPLFPDPDQFEDDQWSVAERGLSLTMSDVEWLWQYVQGGVTDLAGSAEALGLHSLRSSVGLDLDLLRPVDAILTDSGGEVGLSSSELHDLITLSGPEERGSLQFLAGGYLGERKVATRYGPPGSQLTSLNILPNGQLSKTVSDYLRELWRPEDPYPFAIFSERREKPKKYAAHLGVLDALDGPAGPHIRRLMGDRCPTGLIFCEGDGPWEHVPLGEIDGHGDVLEIMLEFGSDDSCPMDPPADNSAQDDQQRFLSMPPVRELLDPFEFARLNGGVLTRVTAAGLLEIVQFLSGPSVAPGGSDFLPLVHVFSVCREDEEGQRECYVCGDQDCGYGHCMEDYDGDWKPSFTDTGWC